MGRGRHRGFLQVMAAVLVLALSGGLIGGCGKKPSAVPAVTQEKVVTITLAAYTVPKEAYQSAIIPAFQRYWKETAGETVVFKESYAASGAQARAIVGGLEADVAALSVQADVETLVKAGLVSAEWNKKPFSGMITRSVVAIGVEKGNPKGIHDWQDLTRPGLSVLYPNPRTSGGAMWDINAIYGGALKMSNGDKAAGARLLAAIQKNVTVMDKSGRESMTTFEKGQGDAVITYENELLLRNMQEPKYEIIYPQATILIENPVAVVDSNVDKHGNRAVVQAFVEFLWSAQAQEAFAKYGFRPVTAEQAEKYWDKYPVPEMLFDIHYLGGWPQVEAEIYGPQGVWTRIVEGGENV